MAIEIVDLPSYNMVIFHSYVNVYQRLSNQAWVSCRPPSPLSSVRYKGSNVMAPQLQPPTASHPNKQREAPFHPSE